MNATAQVSRRQYRDTGISTPLLGFGMMRLPVNQDKIDAATAQAMVDRAMACGVNYFDTAYFYHHGDSEKFIGEALSKYPRSSYMLTDKMPVHILKSAADCETIFQQQLSRTKAGYFDFYFMHWLNAPHWEIAKKFDVRAFMERKRDEGKIRHIGFSFHGEPEKLREIAESCPWDLAQIQLNCLDWESCRSGEQYEILTELGIPVSVMEPLKGGTLTTLCEESREIFRQADPDASVASWGLRFVASLPNIQVVLSGMSAPDQLEDNLSTFTPFRPMERGEREVIDHALAAYRRSNPVPCTGCRYCAGCPRGVDIPRNLAILNHLKTSASRFSLIEAKNSYDTIPPGQNASRCVGCGLCMDKCPQRIKIPSFLREIESRFRNWESFVPSSRS